MLRGVFQHIEQHLADENRVHGHDKQLIRNRDVNAQLRVLLAEAHHYRGDHFLRRLVRFGNFRLPAADARNGQQVFHHADEPLRVLVDILQHLFFLLPGHVAVLLENGRRRAADAGQRRTQIVRDGAQQVAAHLFLLHLGAHAFLPLDLRRHRAGEIQLEIRVREGVVDADHAQKRRGDAVPVAAGQPRNEQHRQHEKHRNEPVRQTVAVQQVGQQRRRGKHAKGKQQIAQEAQRPLSFENTHPHHHTGIIS